MKLRQTIITLLALPAIIWTPLSCQREMAITDSARDEGNRIVFGADGLAMTSEESYYTKADVTSLSSMRVGCTTGSAGSETAVWSDVAFASDGVSGSPSFTGGRYWPESNPSYHFYASNLALTYAAAGTSVSVPNNSTDVVCAYLPSPTYKSKNTLSFKHIFAKLGNVTISGDNGWNISNISVTMTPKVSGTYNICTGNGRIDGTGWSGTANGSSITIANTTAGTKSNNVYMVPGTYTIKASWRATKGALVQDFSNYEATATLVAGANNHLSAALSGEDPTNIEFTVTVTPWANNAISEPEMKDYLRFEILTAGDIKWFGQSGSRTIQYRKNNGEWTSLAGTSSGASISVAAGDVVYFYADSTAVSYSDEDGVAAINSNDIYFGGTSTYDIAGDLSSLCGFRTDWPSNKPYFQNLFKNNLCIRSAEDLKLPFTYCTNNMYYEMFYGCTNMTKAPREIVCSELKEHACYCMFYGCTSLTTVPRITATSAQVYACANMFENCSSLESVVPDMLANASMSGGYCYKAMFKNCTSLKDAPELPSTSLSSYCYDEMFYGCTSLTAAPVLPATTLADNCYQSMFRQ